MLGMLCGCPRPQFVPFTMIVRKSPPAADRLPSACALPTQLPATDMVLNITATTTVARNPFGHGLILHVCPNLLTDTKNTPVRI